MADFPDRLRRRRAEMGLSGGQLAQKVSEEMGEIVTRAMISKYEAGKSYPTEKRIKALEKVMVIKLHEDS